MHIFACSCCILAGSLKKGSSRGISNVNYLAEAELLFRRALVKQEQVLGLTAPETLQSINNFAVFCQKNQKLRSKQIFTYTSKRRTKIYQWIGKARRLFVHVSNSQSYTRLHVVVIFDFFCHHVN